MYYYYYYYYSSDRQYSLAQNDILNIHRIAINYNLKLNPYVS